MSFTLALFALLLLASVVVALLSVVSPRRIFAKRARHRQIVQVVKKCSHGATIGKIGHVGPQGLQGFAGRNIANGQQGYQGIEGIDGLNGLQGNEGNPGSSGSQGSQGSAGAGGGNLSSAEPLMTINAILVTSGPNTVAEAGILIDGNEIRFQPATNNPNATTPYVGLHAPSTLATTYSLALPSFAPLPNQILRANASNPTNLDWSEELNPSALFPPPVASRNIYVTKYGSDVTGDGSFSTPFATLSAALTTANTIAAFTNPLAILISPGIYVEDNTAGPLAITATGISVVGQSQTSVSIRPLVVTNNLISAIVGARFMNLTFDANSAPVPLSTNTGIALSGNFNSSNFNNINVRNFGIGIHCGGTSGSYLFDNCILRSNAVAIQGNDCTILCNACTISGSTTTLANNEGIICSGATSIVSFSGGVIANCLDGIRVQNGVKSSNQATLFRGNVTALSISTASQSTMEACLFEPALLNPNTTDVLVSGASTTAKFVACTFDARSVGNLLTTIAIQVENEATVFVTGGEIDSYNTALTVKTSATLHAANVIVHNCLHDAVQQETATLNINVGSFTGTKISVPTGPESTTTTQVAFFDPSDSNILKIGRLTDQDATLLEAAISTSNNANPGIEYKSSLYNTQALGFSNPLENPASWFVQATNTDAHLTAVTTSKTHEASLKLISDTSEIIGVGPALRIRGWEITKTADAFTANLQFKYQNSDTADQILIANHPVLSLDGVTNHVTLPNSDSRLNIGGDTSLYRLNSNSLKTDGNLTVGLLTPNRVVTTNAESMLVSSGVTDTELATLVNITSLIQIQLDAKVAKAGDAMFGNLTMLSQTEVRFQDAANTGFIALHAPAILDSSYSLALPTHAPLSNQYLRTPSNSTSTLEWVTDTASFGPALARTLYVTSYGSDLTGDGSMQAPFATLGQAINTANPISTLSLPVTIRISAGFYLENNTGSPLTITAAGISIVGDSSLAVLLQPTSLTNIFLLAIRTIQISNIKLDVNGSGSTGIGISLTAGTYSTLTNVRITRFGTGLLCSGTGSNYLVNSCVFTGNGTGLSVNSTLLECDNTTIQGPATLTSAPVNTGFAVTGSSGTVAVTGGACVLCLNGFALTGGSNTTISTVLFKFNRFDLVQTTAAKSVISACSFTTPTSSSDIDIQVSGPGTRAILLACEFDGRNGLGTPQGTGIVVSDSGVIDLSGGRIRNFTTGVRVGLPPDASTTTFTAAALSISDCGVDIEQAGTSTLIFHSGAASSSKLILENSANVKLAFFDFDANNALSIGSGADIDITLLQAAITTATTTNTNPRLRYLSSLYATQAMGWDNPSLSPTTFFVRSLTNEASFTAITSNTSQLAQLKLLSDAGAGVRGWSLSKEGTTAELNWRFANEDPSSSQPLIPEYTLLQLDGQNQELRLLPAAAKIVFGQDLLTNLYRFASGILTTDGNVRIGGLTPNRAVVTNASQMLISVSTTDLELDFLGGVTSPIQDQLNGKVNRAGDTMVGNLTLPAGTPATPSLTFTGSLGTGLSTNEINTLSFSTNAVQRLHILPSGVVIVDEFVLAGVVHNTNSGNLTSSLIVNADIDPLAAISDTKLATINTAGKVANSATTATSANVPGTIVLRDTGSEFKAGTIQADVIGNVTGAASLNVLKTGDTMVGSLILPALLFSGSTNTGISAPIANTLTFSTNGVSRLQITDTTYIFSNLNSVGLVHTDSNGTFSTSLVANADITDGTISNIKLSTASSVNNAGFLVVRDAGGRFATTEITISGIVTNPTDAATKEYVDTAISLGLAVHDPARVVSTTNSVIAGLLIIDGVQLVDGDRVLLLGQTDPVENGLWVAHIGAWTRPADFDTGQQTGRAYVLVLEGTVNAGASWLAITPLAIIGTDPIFFAQFSLPGQTHGANVGTGAGQIFRDQVGNTLNFKTLAAGMHIVVTNDVNEVLISTDATDANIPSTLVARDALGNFAASTITANLTGTASNNVLRTGDSMSGTLTLLTQNEVRFQGAVDPNYIGLRAPAVIATSYTLTLPLLVPTARQVLRAGVSTPTQLEWFTQGGSLAPLTSRTIYVTTSGNDGTGDGSFAAPFASVSKAVDTANGLSSAPNPVTILISTGVYVENNTGTPLTITSAGISLVGTSSTGVLIGPTTFANDLFVVTVTDGEVQFADLTLDASAGVSTATGVSLTGTSSRTLFINVNVWRFNVGLSGGGSLSSGTLNTCVFVGNGTAVMANGFSWAGRGCSLTGGAGTTGFVISGAMSEGVFWSGTVEGCDTGIRAENGGLVHCVGMDFKNNLTSLLVTAAGTLLCEATSFSYSRVGGVSIQLQDAGSTGDFTACYFQGTDAAGLSQGTALRILSGASGLVIGGKVEAYVTGIEIGQVADVSTTALHTNGLAMTNNQIFDVVQQGLASVTINAGSAAGSKLSFADTTNVKVAFFDNEEGYALNIGTYSATTDFTLLHAAIGSVTDPRMEYKFNLYGTRALGYENPTGTASTFFVRGSDETGVAAITSNHARVSRLRLISDVGGAGLMRGWNIGKNATSAELSFAYQNMDPTGQVLVTLFTLLQLDGVNNLLQLPNLNTQIVFAGDTNLFRAGPNLLQTDDDLIIGGLAVNRAVATNGFKQLISSAASTTELNFLAGVTSSIQGQLNGKVSKAGDTISGPLILAAGSASEPSLQFSGGSGTGFFAPASNTLGFATSGVERMRISSAGTITVTNFTVPGVVHNDGSGNLSTALIVNADIAPTAAINDSKLSTITTTGKVANSATTATTSNVPNTIVLRDGNGVITGSFSGDVVGSASLNVLKSGDTMTGGLTLPAGTATIPSLQFTGSTNTGLAAPDPNTLALVVNGQRRVNISSAGVVSVSTLTGTAGLVHNDAVGQLFSALLSDGDVAAGANIADSKLATITTTGKVSNSATTATSANVAGTIVSRDGSGNFAANVITASVVGAASANVLKSGDVMTGTLVVPALQFSGSTGTGISAPIANTLSFQTGGVERMRISSGGTVSINGLSTTPGVVHNDFAGNLTTSLIVNGDVSPTADIADTKLATISTAGKVSNSATTATTAVTANAIVARDGFGNIIGKYAETIQAFTATANGQAVVVNSGISVLLLTHTANRTGLSVTFPASPGPGQLFTIMLGTTNTITLTNVGGGAAVVNPITTLNPNTSNGGSGVTYMYFATTNTWYRHSCAGNLA